jgi:DNA repair protein RecO (recombination protein O)
MEITGFVIGRTPIKEQDAMVHVLAPNGLFSFFARRAMDYKSDIQSATTPFSRSLFVIKEGPQGGLALSSTKLIKSYSPNNASLVHFAVLELISEVLIKVVHEEEAVELFPYLEKILVSLERGADPLVMGAIFLAAGLTASGLRMQIDECVFCQKTDNIVGVSISGGGFCCRECFDQTSMVNEPIEVLKNLRYCFLIPVDKIEEIVIEKDVSKRILFIISEHFLHQMGKKLVSIAIIMKS